jgi:hypothetical protein
VTQHKGAVVATESHQEIVPMQATLKRFAVVAISPLFAAFLYAQDPGATQTETHTTTTKTTLNGTLIDAGCRTTHKETTDTKTSNPDENTSQTTTTHTTTEGMECPAVTTTTAFGIMTSDGRYLRFDDPSNSRIVEVLKGNKKWHTFMTEGKPLKVRVVGSANGDVVVLDSIE